VVKDKDGGPPGELGVSKSVECVTFSLQCSDTVGGATGGHPACKKLSVDLTGLICTTYGSSCHHHLHCPCSSGGILVVPA